MACLAVAGIAHEQRPVHTAISTLRESAISYEKEARHPSGHSFRKVQRDTGQQEQI
jgi:hypothetical protein